MREGERMKGGARAGLVPGGRHLLGTRKVRLQCLERGSDCGGVVSVAAWIAPPDGRNGGRGLHPGIPKTRERAQRVALEVSCASGAAVCGPGDPTLA
jgi:hypothetical protein